MDALPIPQAELSLWQVLHDGYLDEVREPSPGVLQLRVRILYLAERLTPPAEAVRVTLHQVVRADFTRWGAKQATPLLELTDDPPDVVGVAVDGPGLVIHNGEGELRLQYGYATLAHDDGAPLGLDTLRQVAKAYWDDFRKRSP
jgi:hypothetical protein